MQNLRGGRGLSPSILQSTIGLMLLAASGFLVLFILWLQEYTVRGRSFEADIVFPHAEQMTVGTNVSYRGVKIGQIRSITPEPEGVVVEIEISPKDRIIPVNSRIEVVQAGLVGESSIDIIPLQFLSSEEVKAMPLDPDCDRELIICQGSRLEGKASLNVEELVNSLSDIATLFGDPEFINAISSIAKKTNEAMEEFSQLLEDLDIEDLDETLKAINQVATEASTLLAQIRQSGSVGTLNSTLASVGNAADEIKVFAVANQGRVAVTLESIAQTSDQLRVIAKKLDPTFLEKIGEGQLIDNLETTFANTAELTTRLNNVSRELDDPTSILTLQQILDSARASFQNLEKITSDLDELTGNPEFRRDIERLIKGLSALISSTQQLQQQVAYDRALNRLALEMNALNSKVDCSPTLTRQSASNFSSKPTKVVEN